MGIENKSKKRLKLGKFYNNNIIEQKSLLFEKYGKIISIINPARRGPKGRKRIFRFGNQDPIIYNI